MPFSIWKKQNNKEPEHIPNHTEIINWLIHNFNYKKYLEIGLGNGKNFNSINIESKTSVDPGSWETEDSKATFKMKSDDFFAENKEKFDLIFIDGLHHAEVVERDIRNSLTRLNPNGIIVCHDMNPDREELQIIPRQQDEWTGDSWRAWLKIRATHDDLQMFVLDCDYGIGIIYPDGKEKIKQLRLPKRDVSYRKFKRKKKKWLPLFSPQKLEDLLKDSKISSSF